MNFKIVILISVLFLSACQNTSTKKDISTSKAPTIDSSEKSPKNIVSVEKENSEGFITDQKYRNIGFTLIYDDMLIDKKQINIKINNNELEIFHKKIFKNSFVKITNPENAKTITAKVISNDAVFSDFYNSVITKRIAEELSLDPKEPYIDLVLISKNSTFIAQKAETFEEEKKVAEKAPVDGITIDNLGELEKKENKNIKKKFLYSIKIADFYYKDSAENMVNRIKDETNLKNHVIKKLSKTKYRVLLGPFNDIKNLEKSFNEIKSLNFENIEILKDV